MANEINKETKLTLAEEMAMQNAFPFTKLFISHRKGTWKSGGEFDYIEVAELNRYGSGEVVRLSVPAELDTALDALRLGDVVKCYVSLDDLSSTAQKCCLAFEKLFDSQLPMPKTLSK